MKIKIQSSEISFEELAQQYPDSIAAIPKSYGLSGDVLFQVIVMASIEIIKIIAEYLIEKQKEKKDIKQKEKNSEIKILLPSGTNVSIVINSWDTKETLARRMQDAIGPVN